MIEFSVEDLIAAGLPVRVHGLPAGCDRCGHGMGGDGMRYAAGLFCPDCCQVLAEAWPGSLVDRPQWRVFLGRDPDPQRRVEWVAEVRRQVLEFGPIPLSPVAAAALQSLVDAVRRRETSSLIESAFEGEQ